MTAEPVPITAQDLANAVQGATLAAQMTDLQRDMTELKTETRIWRERHETQHDNDERDRRAVARDHAAQRRVNVRFALGLTASMLGGMGWIITLLMSHR